MTVRRLKRHQLMASTADGTDAAHLNPNHEDFTDGPWVSEIKPCRMKTVPCSPPGMTPPDFTSRRGREAWPVQANDIMDMATRIQEDFELSTLYDVASLYTYNGDQMLRGIPYDWGARIPEELARRNAIIQDPQRPPYVLIDCMAEWLIQFVFDSVSPTDVQRPLTGNSDLPAEENPWIRGLLTVGGFECSSLSSADWEICFRKNVPTPPDRIEQFVQALDNDKVRDQLNDAIRSVAMCCVLPPNRTLYRSMAKRPEDAASITPESVAKWLN